MFIICRWAFPTLILCKGNWKMIQKNIYKPDLYSEVLSNDLLDFDFVWIQIFKYKETNPLTNIHSWFRSTVKKVRNDKETRALRHILKKETAVPEKKGAGEEKKFIDSRSIWRNREANNSSWIQLYGFSIYRSDLWYLWEPLFCNRIWILKPSLRPSTGKRWNNAVFICQRKSLGAWECCWGHRLNYHLTSWTWCQRPWFLRTWLWLDWRA